MEVLSQNSVLIFSVTVLLLIFQRLMEVTLSRHNEAAILEQGGARYYHGHYIAMVALHTSWFVFMLAEVWFLERAFHWWLFMPSWILLCTGQTLRYLSIQTLKERWTVSIMIHPESPVVHHGIYRYIRHPNYLGVILEIAAVPLLHSAYLTAFLFSLANALLLRHRIRLEELALTEHNQYATHFENHPRFIPSGALDSQE